MLKTILQRMPPAWKIAIPAFLVMNLIGLIWLRNHTGIFVTIQNTGSVPIQSVVLHVTGNTHRLGDLQPGASLTTSVKPTSQSQLEIEFGTVDARQRLDAGSSFEPSSTGTIQLTIKDGLIDRIEDRISVD